MNPVTTVEKKVHADGGDVGVRRENGAVVVDWKGVEARRLTPEGLEEAIAYLELPALADGRTWVALRDSEGRDFRARVVGDGLEVLLCEQGPSSAPWDELRAALRELAA